MSLPAAPFTRDEWRHRSVRSRIACQNINRSSDLPRCALRFQGLDEVWICGQPATHPVHEAGIELPGADGTVWRIWHRYTPPKTLWPDWAGWPPDIGLPR